MSSTTAIGTGKRGLGYAMRYMLDTNICIYLMRRVPPAVVARFEQCSHGDVCMSAITLAELQCGVSQRSDDRSRVSAMVERLLDYVPALPFEHTAAAHYGQIYQAVRDRRRDALDRLIAANALATDCILVTNNVADFCGYPGLRIENWLEG